MKISEVSDKTNISIHTLRYYEKEGLLLNIQRDSSGQRTFDHADLEWLTWIKRLKSTGMPLAEIKKFAKLRLAGSETLRDRQQLLLTHKDKLKQEIARLSGELEIVQYKIDAYEEKILDLE
ncbi:MerR family transcriptional regulator [Vibrio vulnificus]|uniref:MerR family transcriptional regulator n=1 Tax=Vibrio vulnificus TaxID=672 RepID=UPI00063DA075|nr:MerR family transcriptional regulator [Vibrio vulnificus]EGR1425800.1 MerR family transcriptional regulator [Vibrio vulnificus]EIU7748529.1 MerR family transcriptional regulator [Vibrio vulnificus]EJN6718005.1 MerR family transcriptional regulator [Vibrio vulnificus]EJO9870455.1 MerR family transcriptional regulator [Vibrio vulnificus]EJQ9994326.1 MerR family transcriptional regulator [Vibrio vulnificus]